MKLVTIIRVHGIIKNMVPTLMGGTKSIVKTDNQDEAINTFLEKNPECLVNVETIYDDNSGVLFDIIYLQVDANTSYDDDDDGFDDDTDNSDIVRRILGKSKR